MPFEVPDSWEWCKLGTVNEIARGGSPRPIKDYLTNDASGINWIKIGDTTKDGKYIDSVKERIRPEGVKKSRMVHKGDFLLTNSMSFGRPYILNVDGCIHDGWLVISPIGEAYMSDFLYYLLSSSFAFEQFTNVASGGVVTNLNSDKVADTKFPLPPLAEQKRIVVEIERWFALIDQIEQSQSDLQDTIRQTKSKILDFAIHGKLVPQDPNDEPAIELLKRINPNFTPCDNGHSEKLPQNWSISTVGNVLQLKSGENIKVRQLPMGGKYPIYGGNGINGFYNKCNVSESTIIIGRVGFYCGSVFLTESKAWVTDNALIVSGYEGIYNTIYLAYLLQYLNLGKVSNSTAQPVISRKGINPIPILIPPLSEQQRIVTKIEKLFSVLDNIQNALEA